MTFSEFSGCVNVWSFPDCFVFHNEPHETASGAQVFMLRSRCVRETANLARMFSWLLISELNISCGTETFENSGAQTRVYSKNSCLQFGQN